MRKRLWAVTAALTLVAGAAAEAVPASASADAAPRGYIVVFKDSVTPASAPSVTRTLATAADATVSTVYGSALRGYAAKMSPADAAAVARDSRVAYVAPDRPVRATAQTLPTGIDRADAEQSATADIDGNDERVDVDVAVIDTGIDLDHPDLNVNTAGARNCALGLGPNDGNGHGTHVAGTIGALDNGDGVVGMAPGARLWPVRVLNDLGVGLTSDIICGIDYVTEHADEIEVANMSLGGGGTDDGNCGNTNDDPMHQAICASVDAGVTYAVAAGNDGADAAESTPAAYDEVITVSALADFDGAPGGAGGPTCRTDQDDTFADFSNFGNDVDIIAPGVCILSTWNDGGTDTISGTSMASPHVAGGAALFKANNPGATPEQVKAALQNAGTLDWNDVDDPDNTKERLLNAAGL
ncbi:MAG: S8 family serine peptidase [Streptosporangiales bacterium]|nr:S8 family serine peptidase [Streptosporangiales bacterium]